MNARARLLLLALAVVSLSLRVTAADALQTVSELRALVCCDLGCEHSPAVPNPARCCGVEQEGYELAGTPPLKLPPVSWVAVSPRPLVPAGMLADSSGPRDAEAPPPRGAPVFLLTQVFRI